jgi:hypothetical protein
MCRSTEVEEEGADGPATPAGEVVARFRELLEESVRLA